DQPSRHRVVEPQQKPRDEKKRAAQDDGPEVEFLSAVEEAHVRRLKLLTVRRVLLDASHPASVRVSPLHRHKPVEELEEEEDVEREAEPRVQKARHRPAAEKRRDEAEEPRRIEAEA